MLIFTTMFIAVIVIVALWYVVLRRLRQAWVSYLIVLIVGAAFTILGDMHFIFIGIEIIFFGCALVWLRHRTRSSKPLRSVR